MECVFARPRHNRGNFTAKLPRYCVTLDCERLPPSKRSRITQLWSFKIETFHGTETDCACDCRPAGEQRAEPLPALRLRKSRRHSDISLLSSRANQSEPLRLCWVDSILICLLRQYLYLSAHNKAKFSLQLCFSCCRTAWRA